jgi:hypothetical protein
MKKELEIKLLKNSVFIILMILSLIINKNTDVTLIHPVLCGIGIFIFSIIFIFQLNKYNKNYG